MDEVENKMTRYNERATRTALTTESARKSKDDVVNWA
jgi:hypothetical protein